jgi:hypothetical protein
MSACMPLRRWLPGSRPRSARVRSRTQPADGWSCLDWSCLELTGRPGKLALRTARELVVGHPDELTLAVLAAAPELVAVVLPENCRLPAPVVAELARRRLATIWRQSPAGSSMRMLSRPGSMP